MDLQRIEQQLFMLTCDQQESTVVKTAIALPSQQGAAEDYRRARAHDDLHCRLPPAAEMWQVALTGIELIAVHRATNRLQYCQSVDKGVRASAGAFTKELVRQGDASKYYLA